MKIASFTYFKYGESQQNVYDLPQLIYQWCQHDLEIKKSLFGIIIKNITEHIKSQGADFVTEWAGPSLLTLASYLGANSSLATPLSNQLPAHICWEDGRGFGPLPFIWET